MDPLSATQTLIANGSAIGPGSFADREWLVMGNLGSSTALFLITLLVLGDFIAKLWTNRRHDRWNHPVTIFRASVSLVLMGVALRKGAAAAVLWKWDPSDPVGTSMALMLQRFIDPLADLFQGAAILLVLLTHRALIAQLRRSGWKVPIWESLPMLKRPAILATASFIAAIGVVLTR